MNKKIIINILKATTTLLEKMPESSFNDLINGKGELNFVKSELKENEIDNSELTIKSVSEKQEPNDFIDNDIESLIEKLKNTKERNEAKKLLQNHPSITTKKDLANLAKILKVHIKKNDKKDVLEDKIVESVVGVMLRSKAIKGVNLKSSETITS